MATRKILPEVNLKNYGLTGLAAEIKNKLPLTMLYNYYWLILCKLIIKKIKLSTEKYKTKRSWRSEISVKRN